MTTEHKKLADLPPVTDLGGVVSAAGAILYALEGQAMVLPLENRMKRPEDMTGGSREQFIEFFLKRIEK